MSEQQQPNDEPTTDEPQADPEQPETDEPGSDGDGGEQQPEGDQQTGRRPDFVVEQSVEQTSEEDS
jgi:hypothetical protein